MAPRDLLQTERLRTEARPRSALLDRCEGADRAALVENEAAPPSLPDDERVLRAGYGQYAKPKLSAVLGSIGLNVVYRRGSGAYLERRVDGRNERVLDLVSGYGSALLGHQHPELVRVARANLDEELCGNMQASCRSWAAVLGHDLAQQLKLSVGRDYVIHLLNSGSEVVEAAVRHSELARRQRLEKLLHRSESHWAELAQEWPRLSIEDRRRIRSAVAEAEPEAWLPNTDAAWFASMQSRHRALLETKPTFFALQRSYHGSGSAAAKLSWGKRYRSALQWTGIEVDFVPAERPEVLQRHLDDRRCLVIDVRRDAGGQWRVRPIAVNTAAALFIEPIQGEGGIHPLPAEHLLRLQELCRQHDVPLIADEIQTGMGRTGHFLASEAAGIQPDVVLLAKALGGGMAKIAAIAIHRRGYVDDFSLQHASTFAEDEPSCRIAVASLNVLTRDDRATIRRARELGIFFLEQLRRLQARWPEVIRAARGRGLMLGLEFHPQALSRSCFLRAFDAAGALAAVISGWLLHEAGIRVAPALRQSHTLRLQPPVVIEKRELRRVVAALDRLCALIQRDDIIALTRFVHGDESSSAMQTQAGEALPAQAAKLPPLSTVPADYERGTVYAVAHARPRTRVPRIAFFGHVIDGASVRGLDPCLAPISDRSAVRMACRMEGWVGHFPAQRFEVQSATGQRVEALIVGWNVLASGYVAAMRDPHLRARFLQDLRDAMEEVSAEGCQWVGFGGFTSILTKACRDVRNSRLRVTTGNSLTVGMAAAALERECQNKGIDLDAAQVAIVGAVGNIGSVHARLLNGRVRRLCLIGRPGSEPRMQNLASELERQNQGSTEIQVETRLDSLVDCAAIVTCSNSAVPLVQAEHLSKDPVVFLDVSVPGDAAPNLQARRPAMSYLRGGIVQLPHGSRPSRLELPGWHVPPGHAYACLSETLLLGLERLDEDYSCGELEIGRVHRIMRIADRHGFRLGTNQVRLSL